MCALGQVTEVLSFLICNMEEFASSSITCFSGSFFLPRKKSPTVCCYPEKSHVRRLRDVLIPPAFTLAEMIMLISPPTNIDHHLPLQ